MSVLNIIILAIVQGLAELLPVSSSAHVVVAEKLLGLDPSSPPMTLLLVMLHTGTMFAVEGIGLWMQKRWAEWLTTIITASLIPLEAWEMILRPTIGKALILLANVAVVAYLV